MQVSGNDACPDAPGCETVTTASTTVHRSGHEARTWTPTDCASGASPAIDWISTVGSGVTRAPTGAAATTSPTRAISPASAKVRAAVSIYYLLARGATAQGIIGGAVLGMCGRRRCDRHLPGLWVPPIPLHTTDGTDLLLGDVGPTERRSSTPLIADRRGWSRARSDRCRAASISRPSSGRCHRSAALELAGVDRIGDRPCPLGDLLRRPARARSLFSAQLPVQPGQEPAQLLRGVAGCAGPCELGRADVAVDLVTGQAVAMKSRWPAYRGPGCEKRHGVRLATRPTTPSGAPSRTPSMDWKGFLASVIDSLAWPVAIAFIVVFLRKPLRRLLERRIRFKGLGVEAEFGDIVREAEEIGRAS